MFFYKNINPSPLEIVDLVDIESKKKKNHFQNFISEVINIDDIGLGSPSLF